jgi:hypothetical protein
MKRALLLSTFILSLSIYSLAQDANKAFAITGSGNGDFQWMNIRQIDLATGIVTKNIFEKAVTPFEFRDAVTDKQVVLVTNQEGKQLSAPEYPTATMVAAAAYDKRHNKLFFAPMFINELRWLDLSSNSERPKFYTFSSPLLQIGKSNDEANNITRMTIGADGNGYALTNDGNHLIKFTTGKKVVISDLGALVDASSNDHISVHNKCSCWGGDVVADALGNLYLFTATKNVFKINIDNRIATYIGSITGLSGTYTLNGAAVDNDDNVIISSANTFEGFYKVSMKDLAATKLNTTGPVYNASDLANGNLLFASQLRNTVGVAPLIQREIIGNQFISIYPNPAIGSEFKVTFDNKLPGEYTIILTDIQGKTIFSKEVYVKSAGQVETIQLRSHRANGMYMIKVTNAAKKLVFSDKIILD